MHQPLVIIPTLNERENLPLLLVAIRKNLPEAHILVVDDGSKDGTEEWVRQEEHFEKSLYIIEREKKLGLGTAYVAGFKWALARDYDLIFQMDADFSHNPAALPAFVQRIDSGADVVLGSRYLEGVRVLNWPIARLILSLSAAQYVKTITGMPYTDPTGGFKCFRRKVFKRIDLDGVKSNGYSFQIEVTFMAWLAGFRIDEIPIIFEDRHSGTSKMSGDIAREAMWMVWKLAAQNRFRRNPPERRD
ncbi:MAG: polyprenol monophosphomannose synthase [Verrucomicrobiota bacterium]|nr:polyprenol monophosphomannose synthase [Verrucomicrobiota bacterium]